MVLTPGEKRRLAGRARTLQERLARQGDDRWTVDDPEGWLEEWSDRFADGDPAAFEERLAWEGLSRPECRRRIGANGWPEGEPLPGWVDRVDDVLGYVADAAPADGGVPFGDLLAVLVDYANEQLDDAIPIRHVSEGAREDLDRLLLERLRELCAHPLFIDFKTYVARRDRELAFADDPAMPDEPRRYYDQFVETLFDGGLASFLLEYAFLARLLDGVVRQWVAAVEEFYRRLDSDWTALRSAVGPLGRVTGVEPLGDAHGGGRVVFGVSFDSGTTVAYKPRDVGIEAAFFEFVDWMNGTESLPELATPTCLVRDGYGWMEWVPVEECEEPGEVAGYYRRAGVLVCFLYALGFSDGHLENVLASGDQPVVVDLETLLQPTVSSDLVSRTTPASEALAETVLGTYLLPVNLPDQAFDAVSGFGSKRIGGDGPDVRTFVDVNTDVMELEYRRPRPTEGENLPRVDGSVVGPADHADEIVDGFDAAYRSLVERKDALLDGPRGVQSFGDTVVRYLHRDSRTYGNILALMTTPEYLETGLKFGCKVESLMKSPLVDGDAWGLRSLYDAERNALLRLDVPRFVVPARETAVVWDGKPCGDVFERRPLEEARRRIRELCESDRHRQTEYVEKGFGNVAEHFVRGRERLAGCLDDGVETAIRAAATEAFERIEANVDRDEARTWQRTELDRDGRITIRELGIDLYEGRLGIALFGAALATATGDSRHREFATAVGWAAADGGLDAGAGIGCTGYGGTVYGFTKLGRLLETPRFVDCARDAADSLTRERIEDDGTFDVIAGSAGAILGLVELYDATGDETVLDRALTAGRHLLSRRVTWDGVETWESTRSTRPLTGFAHGVTGIAYALDALAEASGRSRFRDAAAAALEYERRQYVPGRNNWATGRGGSPGEFAEGWCYGRAGIGLARLGMFERDERDALMCDVERALEGLDATTLQGRDHPCCGNAGRIELLLRASRTLDEPGYRRKAERLAAAIVERTGSRGFTNKLAADYWYDPTFFDGEAGVGYTLLRLGEPSLPSVLLFE